MTAVKWSRRVVKGNSTGTGWITIPARLRAAVTMDEWYELTLNPEFQHPFAFILRLSKNKLSWGFYIPRLFCSKHGIIGKTVAICLQHTEYFPAAISADKRIVVPQSVVISKDMQKEDLYEVELSVDSKRFQEIVIISTTDRPSNEKRPEEYYFTVRIQDIPTATPAKVRIGRKVEKLLPDDLLNAEEKIYLPNLFPDAILGKIDEASMIVFLGRHKPIITPISVYIPDIIHYFGCYYADGTKRDHGWSINASTPEQAIYYTYTYKSLILLPKLTFSLTFTYKNDPSIETYDLKNKLIQIWKKRARIEVNERNIHFYESSITKFSEENRQIKHNPIGSLRIRDNRGLVLELHLRLLRIVQSFVLRTGNISFSWLFLFGIMEGDGSMGGGKNRCRILITCKKTDEIIPQLLAKVGIEQLMRSSTYSSKSPNAVYYSFGLIPILKNLPIIHQNLFKYYPKRRKLFVKRLFKLASVQYILNEIDELFPLALHPLKENNIITNETIISTLKRIQREQK